MHEEIKKECKEWNTLGADTAVAIQRDWNWRSTTLFMMILWLKIIATVRNLESTFATGIVIGDEQ